jgi:CubicO group peptidase (beta-lactamase class C family)
MRIKGFTFLTLAIGAVVALALRRHAKAAAAEQTHDSTPYDELDAYVQQHMDRLHIPGAALAVVQGDRIVHERGFGRARPGGETPSRYTPFVLGSVTKSFTALAVMQLVEGGKVELDAPVQRYLPWFRVADPQASAQMTVRHLLNQTSGLPQLPGMLPLADFDARPDATERQARALATVKLTRPAGAAFEYCNMNYNLLGLIVEAASGEPYADYVQKHIFDPLEMNHSYTSQAVAKQNGLAVGHRYWFAAPFAIPRLPMPHGSLPSGQLISCAEDMARYLIAQLNGGRYGDAPILSPAGIDELHCPAVQASIMGVSLGQYAMGWFDDEDGPTRTLWHTGEVPDFFAYMALLPERKKALVLLLNVDQSLMFMRLSDVGAGAARLLAGEQPSPSRLGFIPWALRALLLIPALQVAGVALTLRRLRRWRHDPKGRPSGARKWGANILLPLLPNLLVASPLLGMLGTGTLRFAMLFVPDISWIALLSGSFSLLWSVLRTGLILATLRRPPARALVGRPSAGGCVAWGQCRSDNEYIMARRPC